MYYRKVFKRTNVFKEAFLSFFLAFCSWPRMLIEMFIRSNQGERYFSLSGAIAVFTILAILPQLIPFDRVYGASAFWGHFLTWYGYLAGFLYMTLKRHNEIKHLPSVFDFERFSLSTGNFHPHFESLDFNGKPVTPRAIETFWEPAVFFAGGFVLWMAEQPIGFFIVICSIIYSLSYRAQYYLSDQSIMDKIDEMICSEELGRSLIEGRNASETRGFRFYGHRPADPETRRRMADMLSEMEETVEAF